MASIMGVSICVLLFPSTSGLSIGSSESTVVLDESGMAAVDKSPQSKRSESNRRVALIQSQGVIGRLSVSGPNVSVVRNDGDTATWESKRLPFVGSTEKSGFARVHSGGCAALLFRTCCFEVITASTEINNRQTLEQRFHLVIAWAIFRITSSSRVTS